ncbi:MAG: M1 family aminopeptidase, partial [Candidatus Zixiibacteriota bacterium]
LELEGWSSYHNYMNSMDYSGGGTIYIYDTTNVWNIFGTIVYDKGAWVVHMLRGVLGDSLFFEGVHAYYNSQYQYAAATTEEFRDVFENATGVELDWFFEQWIYGEYRPNYHWAYWQEASDTGGYDVFLHVDQVQTTDPQVFIMPVDFFFDLSTGIDDTLTLWVDKRSNLFKLNFPSTISIIRLDPADWVLKYQLHKPWTLFIITLNEELSDGQQYIAYNDTIEARGGTGSNTYSIVNGALPPGYSIDNNGIISGTTSDTGSFTFTVLVDDNGSNYWDEEEFTIYVAPTIFIPGDVNFNGSVNIVDVTYLVDYLFRSGPPPPVLNAADVNGSCSIAVDDVTYFVDYLFRDGPAPVTGCVE